MTGMPVGIGESYRNQSKGVTALEIYNYPIFPEDMDAAAFEQFPRLLKVGQTAPDGEVTNAADGARLNLSQLWSRKYLVIEFGSTT